MPLLARSALVGAALLACASPRGDRLPPPRAEAPSAAPAEGDDASTPAPRDDEDTAGYIRAHYDKREARIPMRDGVELHTAIYTPKDRGRRYPILMLRTPYGAAPYGPEAMPEGLGPSPLFVRDGYIFVVQDVRGRFLSGGAFVDMRPQLRPEHGPKDIDESTDAYDTISWLIDHVEGHNGRVGMWGISYPGFYAAAGMIRHHPALVAVSPQAPIADWYFDDFHHHGAFFLPHAFNFFARFGVKREGPTTEWPPRFDHGTPDGYQFFLDLGPLANADARHFHGAIAPWTDFVEHPDRDAFWQARDLLPHLEGVAPAVLVVGGLFDAEDLYGPLHVYRAIEDRNPDVFNALVMGPWEHGGWGRTRGERLGDIEFGAATSLYYQRDIEFPFFQHYLKGKVDRGGKAAAPGFLAEATVFETGRNQWRQFPSWPPPGVAPMSLFFEADGQLVAAAPTRANASDAFVSDPARPVPSSAAIVTGMTKEYMTEDQRFAARRPDVLVYAGPPLEADVTVAGPLVADLWVSTSQTDADWVVKLIDVLPDDTPTPEGHRGPPLGGYQMMVRSEVLRGRYRDGYDAPRPFSPNRPTRVRIPLQDVLHTFRAGHRIMIQIQSSWFPMVDRNPQRYVPNIFKARARDFVSATHRVHRSRAHPSRIELQRLPSPG